MPAREGSGRADAEGMHFRDADPEGMARDPAGWAGNWRDAPGRVTVYLRPLHLAPCEPLDTSGSVGQSSGSDAHKAKDPPPASGRSRKTTELKGLV